MGFCSPMLKKHDTKWMYAQPLIHWFIHTVAIFISYRLHLLPLSLCLPFLCLALPAHSSRSLCTLVPPCVAFGYIIRAVDSNPPCLPPSLPSSILYVACAG